MKNYPDGTWEGDPLAPWNQPDPWECMTCGECKYCASAYGGNICLIGPVLDDALSVCEIKASNTACWCFEPRG